MDSIAEETSNKGLVTRIVELIATPWNFKGVNNPAVLADSDWSPFNMRKSKRLRVHVHLIPSSYKTANRKFLLSWELEKSNIIYAKLIFFKFKSAFIFYGANKERK